MSSLFSYELDEAQIRLTLQDSRAVEYSESSWDEFEANFVQHQTHQTQTKFKLPEFHLNINRNIVLPVVFIAALVGVSAIMLSFVDFKTNAPAQVEKQLIPNPDNFKQEQAKTAVITKKEPAKTIVEKPIVKSDSVPLKSIPVKTEVPVINTITTAIAVNSNTIEDSHSSNPVNTNTQARLLKTDTSSVSTAVPANIIPSNLNNAGNKRKKRRRIQTDQIETIKAPSLLGQQEAVQEPELELKLN
jgi:hypothetical protein